MIPLWWPYIINSVLLITHEIESAYEHEWKLFKIRRGITLFLWIHLPLLFIILYGLLEVYQLSKTGLIISMAVGLSGVGAFLIHLFFILRGHKEFRRFTSWLILSCCSLLSLLQIFETYIIWRAYY